MAFWSTNLLINIAYRRNFVYKLSAVKAYRPVLLLPTADFLFARFKIENDLSRLCWNGLFAYSGNRGIVGRRGRLVDPLDKSTCSGVILLHLKVFNAIQV